jgi:hypothetical protein
LNYHVVRTTFARHFIFYPDFVIFLPRLTRTHLKNGMQEHLPLSIFEMSSTLGEAARVVPSEIQERYSDIPWGKMQGIRNVLVHEYFRLDEEILWKATQEDIPPLIAALEGIIAAED